jgi:hypothetical protein
MSLKLFELVDADAGRPCRPFCWRERPFDALDGMARKLPGHPV